MSAGVPYNRNSIQLMLESDEPQLGTETLRQSGEDVIAVRR
jgi:hypothetical protein